MTNERETLTAGTRAIREIVAAFGDWTRSADTARLDELVRLRRSTWLSDLLAARGAGALPEVEHAFAIVRRLLARDLRSVEDAIGKRHDVASRASAILANAPPARKGAALRRDAREIRDGALVAIVTDRDVAAVRDDVAALLVLAEDIDRMVPECATEAEACIQAVRVVLEIVRKLARRRDLGVPIDESFFSEEFGDLLTVALWPLDRIALKHDAARRALEIIERDIGRVPTEMILRQLDRCVLELELAGGMPPPPFFFLAEPRREASQEDGSRHAVVREVEFTDGTLPSRATIESAIRERLARRGYSSPVVEETALRAWLAKGEEGVLPAERDKGAVVTVRTLADHQKAALKRARRGRASGPAVFETVTSRPRLTLKLTAEFRAEVERAASPVRPQGVPKVS